MKTYHYPHVYGPGLPNPWYFNDDPFETNFKVGEEYKIISSWQNNSAEYIIDHQGFRQSGSLDSPLWFFGCSHTFGEALPEGYFADLVGQQLNVAYYNFGTPSASINLIARLMYKLREKLQNKTIIVQIPSLTRFELIENGVFKSANPHAKYYEENLPLNNVTEFLDYRLLQSVMLIDTVTKNSNRYFFTFEDHKFLEVLSPINISNCVVDLAYDGNHYGFQTHKNIANVMLTHVKS